MRNRPGSLLVAAVPVKTGTCRFKRYRQRVRDGVQVVPVEVDQDIIEKLILCGRIKSVDKCCDRVYVGVVLLKLLKEVL